MEPATTIAVAFDKPRQRERAEQLAQQLNLPLAQRLADPHDLHLHVAHTGEHTPDRPPDRLELRLNPHALKHTKPRSPRTPSVGLPVYPNPQSLDVTSPAGRKLNAPLFKAVGIRKGNPHRPHILDATAGFLEDAWLLAAAGCPITALERNPIVHALLEDALHRARLTHPDIAARITLHHADLLLPAEHRMSIRCPPPQVVYLDPMFPPGRKTAEKKPMRLLRMIVGHDPDADQLLHAAIHTLNTSGGGGGGRLVVKRPRHAPVLASAAGCQPVHSHHAKALRYDVYHVP